MTFPLTAPAFPDADLPVASVLSDEEKLTIGRLSKKIRLAEPNLARLDGYYEGLQRLEHIGIAVPPELRRFETVVNIPRMAVDEPERRQGLRAFYRIGNSTQEDPALREAWEFNNLGSESSIIHAEEKVYGRYFVAVGTNPDDDEHPLITGESPRHIGVDVDSVKRSIGNALRLYRDEDTRQTHCTLYAPYSTTHCVRTRNGWEVTDRDDHDLGAVPIVMFANRRRGGRWDGVTEMADVIGLTDGIARIVTNMQIGAETHAVPGKWAVGVTKGDFVDAKTGKMLPTWETYFNAMQATANKDAKFGQFTASDLKNFHDSVNSMLAWCAAVLGLPLRYAGQQSVNPAAEGAIIADEMRLIKNVEKKNVFDGDSWAWVMGLEERFRTGEWGARNAIRTLWFNPATPTFSQRADGLLKLRSERAISIEGMWDELGWDEARKAQEKKRLQQERADEAADPFVTNVLSKLGNRTQTQTDDQDNNADAAVGA